MTPVGACSTGGIAPAALHCSRSWKPFAHWLIFRRDACSDPHQASAALINAAHWPIFLGILSSCGATLVMHTLRLNTGQWGADIVRGVANTFAWAAVCVPAVVGYELATNHRWACPSVFLLLYLCSLMFVLCCFARARRAGPFFKKR
jgi:hypothetical protein